MQHADQNHGGLRLAQGNAQQAISYELLCRSVRCHAAELIRVAAQSAGRRNTNFTKRRLSYIERFVNIARRKETRHDPIWVIAIRPRLVITSVSALILIVPAAALKRRSVSGDLGASRVMPSCPLLARPAGLLAPPSQGLKTGRPSDRSRHCRRSQRDKLPGALPRLRASWQSSCALASSLPRFGAPGLGLVTISSACAMTSTRRACSLSMTLTYGVERMLVSDPDRLSSTRRP